MTSILDFKKNAYSFFIIVAFSLFFFANDTSFGLGKLFFIPLAGSLAASLFLIKKIGLIEILLFLFCVCGTIPYLYYGTQDASFIELPITRLALGTLSCIAIKEVSILKMVKWLTFLTPAIIAIHYLFSDLNEYRYGGFYGDPNYLAICFQVLILCSLLSICIYSNKFIRLLSILNILSILPLILFGLSRAGMATTIIILISYFIYLLKNGSNSKYIYIIIGILIAAFFAENIINMFSNNIDDLFLRLNDLSDDVRGDIDKMALEEFLIKQSDFYFGFGNGNTETEKFLEITRRTNIRVHDSYVAVLVEQGVVGFFLLIIILGSLGYKIYKSKNSFKIIKIGAYFALLINLYSVYCFAFFGFWVIFFFLLNPWHDIKKNV